MSAASDSSLDLPPDKTPSRGREIVIRIYASENRPLTPPDPTHEEPRHNNGAHRLPERPSHPPTPETTPPRASIKQFRPEPQAETPPRLRSRGRKTRRHGACDSTIDLPKRGRYNTSTEDTEFLKPLAMSVADRQESTVPDRAQDTHHQPVPSLSLEQFRKDIGWPSADNQAVTDTDNPDSQRLSGVSTTASTVEAMIVDDPARLTKRMLRHTEKRSSLRSASSPVTRSERTSLDSDPDSHHRLVHKAARITEQDRKSIASEFSTPAGPTTDAAPHQQFDVVPVVVIPERRSSLKSSSSVRNPSKASSSRRATTEPGSRASSLGPAHKRKQTMSDTVPVFLQNTDSNGHGVRRPVVPPRRSSLSAPTSANNSRAASLTSESLQSHTLAMEEMQKRRAEQPAPQPAPEPAPQPQRKSMSSDSHNVSEAPKTQSILIGVEDIAHLRTPSMPFSLGSMPSSPGTFELNEATAVSLFPHNNESLLLVDQQMRAEKQKAQAQVDVRGESNNPHTPAMPSQNIPRQDAADVDSPWRNPRPAPQPPICQVIPPTPMKELEQQSSKSSDQGQGSGIRRFGSLRRAWSLRSRSESTSATTTASSPVKRSFSTSATNRKAGKEIDSRLHPFWRPRRFWDDDSSPPKSPEKESPTHNQTDMPKENDHIVKNSLGMPQPRIILNGPTTISTRRNNNNDKEEPHKRLLYDPALNRSTMALNRTSKVFSFPLSLRQRRFNPLSWWGNRHGHGHRVQTQSPFATVRNLRKRIRRRLQLREEAKREAQRARLKESIGEVVSRESCGGTGVLSRGL